MVTFCRSLCFQLREAVSEVTDVMGKFRKNSTKNGYSEIFVSY